MRKCLKKFWPSLVFLLIFFGIFYKIFIGLFPIPGDLLVSWFFPYNSGGWTGYSTWITHKEFIAADVVRQIFPWRDIAIEILKNGQIPLWNPYSFSGYPLLANLQSAVFYPFNFLFFIFQSKVAWIIYILSQPILAFIFMYLFIRSLCLSKYAAIFCGLSFGFIGYFAVWFEWGVVGHSGVWLPLILFGITKYFKTKSSKFLALSSFSLACSLFAGHIQTTTYVAITTFLYYIYCVFSLKKSFQNNVKTFFTKGWFILLALGIAAIQILPSLELLQFSARNVPQSIEIFHRFQLPFSRLITIFAPDFFGNPGVGNAWGNNYAEFSGYFGIVTLIFAVVGLIYSKQKNLIYFFLLLSGISLTFALPTPFSEALTKLHVPVLDTSSPARILFIFQFSFVVLAGFGIDIYLQKKSFIWKSLFLLGSIYLGLWIFTIIAPFIPQATSVTLHLSIIKRNLFIPTIIFTITLIHIFIGIRNNKFRILAFFCFIILSAYEYQYFMYKYSPFSPLNYFFPKQSLVTYLQETTRPHRVYGYGIARIETNLPVQWRIFSPEGYDSLYIKRYGELINASYPRLPTRSDAFLPDVMPTDDSYAKRVLMDIMDIKYAIYKNDLAPTDFLQQTWRFPTDRFKLIYQNYKWEVHENLNALPRAGIFYDFVVEKEDNAIIAKLFDEKFRYKEKLILEENPSIAPTADKEATKTKIISYSPNEIAIEANAENDGLLFLSDNFYPGWTATVDNIPTKIYRADYAFRAVVLKKGSHMIIFKYLPNSFIYGACISTVSLIMLLAILLKPARK